MSEPIQIKVPDIGDCTEVPIIEVIAAVGDQLQPEDPIVLLESDKATMEVPTPQAGTVTEIYVKIGDKVSAGSVLIALTAPASKSINASAAEPLASQTTITPTPTAARHHQPIGKVDIRAEVLVLGAGPGGYTAAFRAADLGKQVVLVERYPTLGGVCLNVGCIPSKALLHVATLINDTQHFQQHGLQFGKPDIDLDRLRVWKNGVIKKLTTGLAGLAKKRQVNLVQGIGTFASPNTVTVATDTGPKTIQFEHAIIAAGSQPTQLPNLPYHDNRLMDSTAALALITIPSSLLIIGGGIIGLEMATIYHALGSKITLAELSDGLLPGCDRDLIKPLQKVIAQRYDNIYLNTKVLKIEPEPTGLRVFFQGENVPDSVVYERVLVAVGRRANGAKIGAEQAGVLVNAKGFISVDKQQRTNVKHIFAIGDIVGHPMLAHKAAHEGRIAAEVIAGYNTHFEAKTIPSVAYTDPEVAWMGLSETEAKQQGIAYEKGSFPWAASGRALSNAREEGITKLLFDRETKQLIGAGIVGTHAGELIAELVLALEMGVDVEDLSLTIHPHPTLAETVAFAAELTDGTITDLYAPRKKPW